MREQGLSAVQRDVAEDSSDLGVRNLRCPGQIKKFFLERSVEMEVKTFNTTRRLYTDEKRESDHRLSVLASIESAVEGVLDFLTPIEKIWQPSDFLPDLSLPNWKEELVALRESAQSLKDDVMVVLVGDMITEEALPSYQTELNRMAGINDPSGTESSIWARWSRGWTAEENRHGDLLNRYLTFSGRVDMRSIEVTIQHLIRNGFSTGSDRDAYKGFVYTSFQERATKISHRNVGKIAGKQGEAILEKICHQIANDEARHEEAYKTFMDKIFEVDPNGAILAFRKMMKTMITMPARLMEDGKTPDIFEKFKTVAQRIKVYTTLDYAEILDHLVARWKVCDMPGLSGEAARAQDFLGGLSNRYRRLAERFEKHIADQPPLTFSWVHDRAV